MAKTRLTEKERTLVKELTAIAQALPEKDKERLVWLGQGILFATSGNGKTENN